MLETVILTNARIPGQEGLQQILIKQGVIEVIAPLIPVDSETIPRWEVAGDWISLGGVDLQINGALGLAFPDLDKTNVDKLNPICEFLWKQGIDGFLPTIVTTSVETIQRSLSTLSQFIPIPHPSSPFPLTPHPSPLTPHPRRTP